MALGTGVLPRPLNLDALKEVLDGIFSNSHNNNHGLDFRLEEDGDMATFHEGDEDGATYIVRSSNPDELKRFNERLLTALAGIGVLTEEEAEEVDLEIQNIVANGDLGDMPNLSSVAVGLGLEQAQYEPEQFPNCFYDTPSAPCILNISPTGTVVIPGAKSEEDLVESFRKLVEELAEVFPSQFNEPDRISVVG